MVYIKNMPKSDIKHFLDITKQEGWRVDKQKILKVQTIYPELILGAYIDKKLVGGISGFYHQKSSWIGNFVISKEQRGEGIGKKLFSSLLNILKQKTKSIYLNAVLDMESFYKSFGFQSIGYVNRYEKNGLSANKINIKSNAKVENIIYADQKIFNENRALYYKEILQDNTSIYLQKKDAILGARIYEDKVLIAPFISKNKINTQIILSNFLLSQKNKACFLDIPQKNTQGIKILHKCGFKKIYQTKQMRLGENLNFNYKHIYSFGSSGAFG